MFRCPRISVLTLPIDPFASAVSIGHPSCPPRWGVEATERGARNSVLSDKRFGHPPVEPMLGRHLLEGAAPGRCCGIVEPSWRTFLGSWIAISRRLVPGALPVQPLLSPFETKSLGPVSRAMHRSAWDPPSTAPTACSTTSPGNRIEESTHPWLFASQSSAAVKARGPFGAIPEALCLDTPGCPHMPPSTCDLLSWNTSLLRTPRAVACGIG